MVAAWCGGRAGWRASERGDLGPVRPADVRWTRRLTRRPHPAPSTPRPAALTTTCLQYDNSKISKTLSENLYSNHLPSKVSLTTVPYISPKLVGTTENIMRCHRSPSTISLVHWTSLISLSYISPISIRVYLSHITIYHKHNICFFSHEISITICRQWISCNLQ